MSKFDDLLYKAKTVASAAGKRTGEVVELSKLKLQVVQLNGDIDKIYRRIGELTYSQFKNANSAEESIKAAIEEVDNIFEQIDILTQKINEQQSTIKCENCGAYNSTDAIFCSRCGKTLIMAQPMQESKEKVPEAYVEVVIKEPENKE